MIENLIVEIKSAIGTDVGNRVYSVVAPVNVTFPCVVIDITATRPYHSKDGTNRKETEVMVVIMAKESSATDSAFAISYDLGAVLASTINSTIVSGTEYRVMDISTDYEDEVGVFKTMVTVLVQSDY